MVVTAPCLTPFSVCARLQALVLIQDKDPSYVSPFPAWPISQGSRVIESGQALHVLSEGGSVPHSRATQSWCQRAASTWGPGVLGSVHKEAHPFCQGQG